MAKVIFLQASVCPQGGVLSPGGVWSGGGGGGVSPPLPPNFFLFFLTFFFWFFFDFFGNPPPEADSGIWSTSGRYASYWNAFLLHSQVDLACNDITHLALKSLRNKTYFLETMVTVNAYIRKYWRDISQNSRFQVQGTKIDFSIWQELRYFL